MNKTFKYSVLKYVHSQFLGEELNIGIVFLFPKQDKFVFRHPKKINKFKNIYRSFSETKINEYLKAFDRAAEKINGTILSDNLDKILNNTFLVKDAATLQFSESKSVILYDEDTDKVVEQYFKLYFPEEFPLEIAFEKFPVTNKQRHDGNLVSTFKKLLREKDKTINQYLKLKVEIKNEWAYFRPDVVWENHTKNAVKGLSLDLGTEEGISDKALLYNAKLNYLADQARTQNIRFDLLIAAPQQSDLKKVYEGALQILHDIKAPKEIITEDQLEKYAARTISEIVR